MNRITHSIAPWSLLMLLLMTLGSCDRLDIPGMFVSSGSHTEDRVQLWLDWNDSQPPITLCDVPDQYSVYVCSDIHLTDSAPRVERFLQVAYRDTTSRFCIINGDVANQSGERPFRVLDSVLRHTPLRDTCFVTLGNHDIYFDCQQYFQQYFHTSTYAVTVQTVGHFRDLFLFLDSGNATHGRKQLAWLKQQLVHRDQYRHVVVCSHTCLFRNSYNYSTTPAANLPLDEYYELVSLLDQHQVDLYLMGHFHHPEEHQLGYTRYVMTDNLNEDQSAPTYLIVECGDRLQYQYQEL